MELLKFGLGCFMYTIQPFFKFTNDFLKKFELYQQMNASVVMRRTKSETNIVIPLSLTVGTVTRAVQTIGNVIVYFMCLCLRPSSELVSFISRRIYSNAQMMFRDNLFLQYPKWQLCSFISNAHRFTVKVAMLALNGILMVIFSLIVVTMILTLFLTPFVPLLFVFTITVTMLIALTLISAISRTTRTLTGTIQRTFGFTVLASICVGFMGVATLMSCAVVLCWIFIISSLQVFCVIVSACMIVFLFAAMLILTVMGKILENEVSESPEDGAMLSFTFSKKNPIQNE